MCTTKKMTLHPLTAVFKEQSCTCLVNILPPAPTAKFYASPKDNSNNFGILEVGTFQATFLTGAWLDLDLSLVLGDSGAGLTIQYSTTLLSLCREISLLARHLHKTFNTFNNKTSTTQ